MVPSSGAPLELTPVDDLPEGLLLRRHCALASGERKRIEVTRAGAVIRVHCRVSVEGELASDVVSEFADAEAIGWIEAAFGLDLMTRSAGPPARTERHSF